MARRANCSRTAGRINPSRWIGTLSSVYLCENEKPVFDPLLRAGQVAVSRFLKHVVAGQEHPDPPRLEHDEFNRIRGIPDAPYDTLICQNDAYSIIHLFLHDYDDNKILSFCSGMPFFFVMSEQEIWNANKRAILGYVPTNKNLKLIWERDPKTGRIIEVSNRSATLERKTLFRFFLAGEQGAFMF